MDRRDSQNVIKLVLLAAEGAFWLILCLMFWPITLAYLGYRMLKRLVLHALSAKVAGSQ